MPLMGPLRVCRGSMITPLECRLWPKGGPKGAQTKIGPKPWIHHLGVARLQATLQGIPSLVPHLSHQPAIPSGWCRGYAVAPPLYRRIGAKAWL